MQEQPSTKTVNTGIKLDESLHARLKTLGSLKQRSPHWLMKTAIEEYVRREETYELEKAEDMQRWQNYKLSGHAITNEATEEWLSSWGSENELPCPK